MKLSPGQMSCEDCRRRECAQTGPRGEDLVAFAECGCLCDCHDRTEAERAAEDLAERLDTAYADSFAQLVEEDAPWL